VIGGSKYDVIHTGPKLVQLSGDCWRAFYIM
jgi:hypothetical protein